MGKATTRKATVKGEKKSPSPSKVIKKGTVKSESKDVDISERDDIRKVLLDILISNDLNDLSASSARSQLESKTKEKFQSSQVKKQIRFMIKSLLVENPSKFSKYKPKSKPKTPTKRKTPTKKVKRETPKKLFQVSEALQKIVGMEEGERKEISAELWKYIKEKDLQNPKNRREILCDDLLKEVCSGETKLTTLQVTSHLNKNITAIEGRTPKSVKKSPERKAKPIKMDMEEDDDEMDDFSDDSDSLLVDDDEEEVLQNKKAKKPATRKKKETKKSKPKKETKPKKEKPPKIFQISEALQKIVGMEEGERKEISAELWKYIKEKDLQNPKNRREILCDDLLKEVCSGATKLTTLQVTSHLNKNITAIDNKAPKSVKKSPRKKAAKPVKKEEEEEDDEMEEFSEDSESLAEEDEEPPKVKKNDKIKKEQQDTTMEDDNCTSKDEYNNLPIKKDEDSKTEEDTEKKSVTNVFMQSGSDTEDEYEDFVQKSN